MDLAAELGQDVTAAFAVVLLPTAQLCPPPARWEVELQKAAEVLRQALPSHCP